MSHFVSRGRRRLHYSTAGSGPVTVFFEAGLGKSRSTWARVQPEVAEFARTVVYDRAGHGLSDPDDEGRGIRRLLDDHLAVLDTAADGPCVLVGHSYGGPLVRLAARCRPDLVMGVVLVDEVSEIVPPRKMMAAMRGASALYGAQVVLSRLGLLGPLLERSYYRTLTGDALRTAVDEGSTVKSTRAARQEWRNFRSSFTALHETGPHIPAVPLTTISSNRIPTKQGCERDVLGAAHRRAAELSAHGRHVYAAGRSHYVQFEEPDLVVDEIRSLVRRLSVSGV
nr:alpha/beta hydrolase fold family protein [Rhodococcus sp. JVH1]